METLQEHNLELLEEVQEDILEFGERFEVYAIYYYIEDADFEWIADYIHATPPSSGDTLLEDMEQAMEDYNLSLELLNRTKNKKMTLDDLATHLQDQADSF